jgi:hypothetical protein
MRGLSIDEKLMSYELAIENALKNNVILSGLSGYGYDKTRIDEGKIMLLEARTLYERQKVEYAGKYGVTESLQKASEIAYDTYMKTLGVARIAYKNDVSSKSKLVLEGERKRNLAGWIDQAERMYKNLLDMLKNTNEPIGKFGYTTEKLSAEFALINKVKELNMEQKKETGEAQEFTRKKDEAINKIDEWIGDYLKIAGIAFKDNEEILEQLGIKSSRRKVSKGKTVDENKLATDSN